MFSTSSIVIDVLSCLQVYERAEVCVSH